MIAKAAGDKNYGCRCLYIGGHMAQAREWKSESIISLRNRINHLYPSDSSSSSISLQNMFKKVPRNKKDTMKEVGRSAKKPSKVSLQERSWGIFQVV